MIIIIVLVNEIVVWVMVIIYYNVNVIDYYG